MYSFYSNIYFKKWFFLNWINYSCDTWVVVGIKIVDLVVVVFWLNKIRLKISSVIIVTKIKAIICATGGSSSNQLIEHLDFNLIKKNPKIFLGYSDITALLLPIYKKNWYPNILWSYS